MRSLGAILCKALGQELTGAKIMHQRAENMIEAYIIYFHSLLDQEKDLRNATRNLQEFGPKTRQDEDVTQWVNGMAHTIRQMDKIFAHLNQRGLATDKLRRYYGKLEEFKRRMGPVWADFRFTGD